MIISMKQFLLALAIVASAFTAQAQTNLAPLANPFPRTISVTGFAKKTVTPDKAVLTLNLRSYGDGRKTVRIEDSEQDLIKALEKAGIPKSDLTTSGTTGSSWFEKRGRINTDQFRTYSIVVHRPNQVALLLNSLNEKAVANAYTGNFELTSQEKEMDKLRTEALQNARGKAQSMAAALDQKVGKPVSINENFQSGGMLLERTYKLAAMESVAPDAPQPLDLDFQPLELNTTVQVVFSLD